MSVNVPANGSCGDYYPPQYWQDTAGNVYQIKPWQLQAPVGNSFDWENTGLPPRQQVPEPDYHYSWAGTSSQPVDLTQVRLQVEVTDKRKKKKGTTRIVQISVQEMLDQLTPAMKRKIIQKVALDKALEKL